MPRIMFACLCAAVLAVLPACGSGGQEVPGPSAASTGSLSADSGTSGSSSGSDSTSVSDTTPPPETGGTESARPTQGGQGSLITASLPIGANLDGDGCLTINFLDAASTVPADMRLVVTLIKFDPQVFELTGSGCSGSHPVCRVGLVLTESSTDDCLALVRTSPSAVVGTRVRVKVAATVDCTGGQVAACRGYQEKLQSDANSEQLGSVEVPEPTEPETTPTDEAPSPPDSAGPSDSGSDSSSDSSSDSGTTSSS
jgi:hypothetical protein